jgi:hypothetical protein
MDGAWSHAEALCSSEPQEAREACVDAAIKAKEREWDAEFAATRRALEILGGIARKACEGRPPSARQACSLRAADKQLGALKPSCTGLSSKAEYQCMVHILIERYGP